MTTTVKWWMRGYWALATVVLPLVNPVILALLSLAADEGGPSWVPIALCIAAANGLLLWLAASRLWEARKDRMWRVPLALALAVALSIPYGFGELILILDLGCPDAGCLN